MGLNFFLELKMIPIKRGIILIEMVIIIVIVFVVVQSICEIFHGHLCIYAKYKYHYHYYNTILIIIITKTLHVPL